MSGVFFSNSCIFKIIEKKFIEAFYAKNGNLKTDLNKGINHINYNFLNLPAFVLFKTNNAIAYLYDAAGIKLKQINYNEGIIGNETETIGNFTSTMLSTSVYENGSLKFCKNQKIIEE